MKRPIAVLAAALLIAGALATDPASAAAAADCPAGDFCVWTGPDFTGQRFTFSGDEEEWDDALSQKDTSWVNHAQSGPGVKDHIVVYSGRDYKGGVTLCLAPGQEVSRNRAAADRGASSRWTAFC